MTERDTERLRSHLAAAETPTGNDCADAEEIWAASRGELPVARARELLEHSLHCSACAEAWRMARDVGAEAPTAAHGRTSRTRWVSAAGLAVAAVVALVFLVPRWMESPGTPTFRDDDGLRIETLIPEDVSVARNEATLRWTAGPEGSLYDVEVADENLDALHVERDLAVNELTVPAEALDRLASGARLLWRVEIVLPDGSRVASPTFIHRVE